MKAGLIFLNIYLLGTSALTVRHHSRSSFPLEVKGSTSSPPDRNLRRQATFTKRATGRGGGAGRSRPSNPRPSGQPRANLASSSSSSSSSSSGMSSDSSDSTSRRSPKAHAKIKIKGGRGEGGEVGKFQSPENLDYHTVQPGDRKRLKVSGDSAGVIGNVGPGGYFKAKAKGKRITYNVNTSNGGTARLNHLVDGRPHIQAFPAGTVSAQQLPNPGGGMMQANLNVEGTGQASMFATKE